MHMYMWVAALVLVCELDPGGAEELSLILHSLIQLPPSDSFIHSFICFHPTSASLSVHVVVVNVHVTVMLVELLLSLRLICHVCHSRVVTGAG